MVNFRYQQMMTAQAFGKMPHEWDLFPKQSQAEAMAFMRVKNKIEAYRWEERKAK